MLGFKPQPVEVVKAVDPQVRESSSQFRGTFLCDINMLFFGIGSLSRLT